MATDDGANYWSASGVVRCRQDVQLVRREVRRVGGEQDVALGVVVDDGHRMLRTHGPAAWVHADHQPVAGIDVDHSKHEGLLGHSCHRSGPSMRAHWRWTCDSPRASGSVSRIWPHGQPVAWHMLTNICCTASGCAPPPTGWVLTESHTGHWMMRKSWFSEPSMLVVCLTVAGSMVPPCPSSS